MGAGAGRTLAPSEARVKARILLFAKAPVAGRVKTRLIPALGVDGAARLARRMLAATLREAQASGLAVELCGEPDPQLWGPVSLGIDLTPQGEGDLGARLARATRRTLDQGEAALLIGADCPELDAARLHAAAVSLETKDAVIHPAADGGYVLLGLRRFDPDLFAGLAWSGPTVAQDTIARIEGLGWSLDVRETLRDIDEPADLVCLPKSMTAGGAVAAPARAR
jgi:rSAM/selenodomain-associated transferase 1